MNNQEKNIWSFSDSTRRRVCMLMITHACNLNCKYCYEEYKSNKKMSFETAKKAILTEAEKVRSSPDLDELEIDFMGGEPLMNFELIRQIVEWLNQGSIDIPFICFGSTNGTLLTEERKQWFRKNRDTVWLSLSYDGTEAMQLENRGSKDEIDLEFFLNTWPGQGVQMTVSRKSLPHLAEGILFLQKRGIIVTLGVAQGEEWTNEDAVEYLEQLRILSEAYLLDRKLTPITRLMRELTIFENSGKFHQQRYCGTGTNMIAYDADGERYGCHLFTPLVLGEKAAKLDSIDWNCASFAEDNRCSACVLKNYCGTCAGFNYKYRNSPALRDMSFCQMYLAEAIAGCELQLNLLADSTEHFNKDAARHAQAVLRSYELLKNFSVGKSNAPFLMEKGGKDAK